MTTLRVSRQADPVLKSRQPSYEKPAEHRQLHRELCQPF